MLAVYIPRQVNTYPYSCEYGMDVDSLPPSLLTPTQREYLRQDDGESIDSGSADERAIRARIRGRLRAGFYDFALLSRQLEPRDRETVFAAVDDGGASPNYLSFVADILRLLFVGLLDEETATQGFDTPEDLFNHIIGTAIESSFPEQGIHVDGAAVEIAVKGFSRTLAPGETANYRFSGEIENFETSDREATGLTVDGEEADPAIYSSGSEHEEDEADPSQGTDEP